ncbi:MAG: hypothetical protein AAB328_10735 [candidate division NC10 bacterium]
MIRSVLALALVLGIAVPAAAEYPERPVTALVVYPAGGLADLVLRATVEGMKKKFPKTDPNQIAAEGMGWQRPADESDPSIRAKNRRVEVKVYPLEAH